MPITLVLFIFGSVGLVGNRGYKIYEEHKKAPVVHQENLEKSCYESSDYCLLKDE